MKTLSYGDNHTKQLCHPLTKSVLGLHTEDALNTSLDTR